MLCSKCKKDLPEEKFYFRKDRNKRRSFCNDCQREYAKSWVKKNPEHCKEYARNWIKNHPEKKAEYWKRWATKYPKKYREWKKKNSMTESGKLIRARIRHKRRAIAKGVENTLTLQEWLDILKEQNNCCAECGLPFTVEKPAQKDHKIPLTEGGAFTRNNIQALCRDCNVKKDATLEKRKENRKKYG